MEEATFFDTQEEFTQLEVLSVPRSSSTLFSHFGVAIFTLDLFVVFETQEILKFREVLLMSRYEVIDVKDCVSWNRAVCGHQPLVGLLGLRVAREQEHFVFAGETIEVTVVPLEHFKHLAGQFGVEALAAEFAILRVGLNKVFIVKVVESPIFLLRHISQAVESLDIPTRKQLKVRLGWRRLTSC